MPICHMPIWDHNDAYTLCTGLIVRYTYMNTEEEKCDDDCRAHLYSVLLFLLYSSTRYRSTTWYTVYSSCAGTLVV